MTATAPELAQTVATLGIPGYGPDEVRFMGNAVQIWQPRTIMEWGTNRGSSARIWFEATRELGTTIHTIELPDELAPVTNEHAGEFTGMYCNDCDRVVMHRGDGAETALALLSRCGRPALVFIDGNHEFRVVEHELARVAAQAPDAMILLHDTNHPSRPDLNGPAEAVRLLRLQRGGYDVLEMKSQAGMVRLTPRGVDA